MKQNRQGFTLIEIIVVATIIGLLATLGLFSYAQISKQSRDAKRKTDLEGIRSAIELYRSTNNSYPVSVTFGGDICDPGGCAGGTYMKTVPNDPKSATGATYYYTGSTSDYTIGALMEGTSTSSCGNCGTATCNYCVGPYGPK